MRLQSFLKVEEVSATGHVGLVHVSNNGGWLTGLGAAGGTKFHYASVEIDGQLIGGGCLAATRTDANANSGFGTYLRFEHDLRVLVWNDHQYSVATYWASWMTDGSELIESRTYVERGDDGIDRVFLERDYLKEPTGDTYSVRTLEGEQWIAEVQLETPDTIGVDERIVGSVQIDRTSIEIVEPLEPGIPAIQDAELVAHLPGRTTPLFSLPLEFSAIGGQRAGFATPLPADRLLRGTIQLTPLIPGAGSRPTEVSVL